MHRHFGFKHHDTDTSTHRHRWMRGPFGHHPMHGRHRHGGGRFFDQGDLRLVILSILAEAPGHGYHIIKTVEERTGGAYAPSPGVVYPTLTLLEEQGLIEQAGADGAKKLYAVTDAGRQALEADKISLKAIMARLSEAGEGGRGHSPRLMRAQINLKAALKMRLMRGPLSPEQAETIITALDAATRAIDEA